MTVPNLLTLLRILLTPLLVWFLLDDRLNEALAVFIVAGMTDGLDGLIARLFNQKSKLGAYLDPLADKLLLVTSFILLAWLRLVPSWLVIITVSRDIIIVLGIITLMYHQVPVKIKPSGISKMTTLMQLLTVLFLLASSLIVLPRWGYTILFLVTAAFSVASGIHYISIGVSMYERSRGQNEE